MKKLIVLCVVLTALFTLACKKKEKDPEPTTPVDTQVYCVYWYNGGVKTFYKCATGKDAANAIYNEIKAGGNEAEAIAKNSCEDCQ